MSSVAKTQQPHSMPKILCTLSNADKLAFKDAVITVGIILENQNPYLPYLKLKLDDASGDLKVLYQDLMNLPVDSIDRILSLYPNI